MTDHLVLLHANKVDIPAKYRAKYCGRPSSISKQTPPPRRLVSSIGNKAGRMVSSEHTKSAKRARTFDSYGPASNSEMDATTRSPRVSESSRSVVCISEDGVPLAAKPRRLSFGDPSSRSMSVTQPKKLVGLSSETDIRAFFPEVPKTPIRDKFKKEFLAFLLSKGISTAVAVEVLADPKLKKILASICCGFDRVPSWKKDDIVSLSVELKDTFGETALNAFLRRVENSKHRVVTLVLNAWFAEKELDLFLLSVSGAIYQSGDCDEVAVKNGEKERAGSFDIFALDAQEFDSQGHQQCMDDMTSFVVEKIIKWLNINGCAVGSILTCQSNLMTGLSKEICSAMNSSRQKANMDLPCIELICVEENNSLLMRDIYKTQFSEWTERFAQIHGFLVQPKLSKLYDGEDIALLKPDSVSSLASRFEFIVDNWHNIKGFLSKLTDVSVWNRLSLKEKEVQSQMAKEFCVDGHQSALTARAVLQTLEEVGPSVAGKSAFEALYVVDTVYRGLAEDSSLTEDSKEDILGRLDEVMYDREFLLDYNQEGRHLREKGPCNGYLTTIERIHERLEKFNKSHASTPLHASEARRTVLDFFQNNGSHSRYINYPMYAASEYWHLYRCEDRLSEYIYVMAVALPTITPVRRLLDGLVKHPTVDAFVNIVISQKDS